MTGTWRLDPSTRSVALTVLRYGPISRAEIARRLGLSSGSLTRLTKPLLEQGVVEQGAPAAAEIGRPALPLRVVDRAARFLGIKIVPGRAYIVSCGLAAQSDDAWSIEIDTSTLENAAQGIARVVGKQSRLGAVGVVLPATVDVAGGLHATRMLGWGEGGNLARRIEELTGIQTATANDVDGLTLYHHWFGAGRGAEHFCTVTFGAGVGVGAVTDDRLLLGHEGAATILGRLWTREGHTFGDVLSERAVAQAASMLVGHEVSFAEALNLPAAAPAVADACRWVGQLVRVVAVAYAPTKILVTGEGIDLLRGSLEVIQAELEYDWREDLALPELSLAPLDFYDFARGAAAHAIRLTLAQ